MIFIKIVCLFFLLILISVIISKFKINLINFEIHSKDKIKVKFKLNFEIYLFNIIRIIIFSCNENNIKIFNKKVEYIKIYKNLRIKNILNKQIKNYFNFKDLNINLDKIDLECKLDILDPIITSYLITIISIFLSNIINSFAKKMKCDSHRFKILSIYSNDLIVDLKLKCIISIKMIHILYVIKKQKMRRKNNNERASNRRSYVSGNG